MRTNRILQFPIWLVCAALILAACGQGGLEVIPSPATLSPLLPVKTVALAPRDAQMPASGVCLRVEDDPATIEIYPDAPVPRCAQVVANQHLKVINRTEATINVRLAHYDLQLKPGETYLFDLSFGSYLAHGVHHVFISSYGGSGPELWLTEE